MLRYTGRKNGACVLLEHNVEEDLLWYPCRHHVHEIILESVVSPSGPYILVFKRFQSQWSKISTNSYEILENYHLSKIIYI